MGQYKLMDNLTRQRMKITLIALGVVFGGVLAFNVVKSLLVHYLFTHYVPPAVSVSSAVAKSRPWKPRLSAVGNFVAVNGVDVNAQLGGTVTAIHFNSGQYIEKGSPLIDLDDSVDQASLKFNQADLTLQQANFQRQIDLQKRNATAASSVDEARAKLLKAEANLQKSQAILNQKHIIAPFSGMLGLRQVNLGQYVQPGQTGIVTLQSMDPIFLRFFMPEQWVDRINLNQNVLFSIEQAPDFRFQGKITAINSKVDDNTHMVEIQASVSNCPAEMGADPKHSSLVETRDLRDGSVLITCDSNKNKLNHVNQFFFMPGIFADISIDQPAVPHVVFVPTTAISFTMYGDSVFVIEKNKTLPADAKDQDIFTVRRVFVTTGEQQGNDTVIKKGIQANDVVVATGELKLEDGTRVTINNQVQLPDVKNIDELGQ